MPPPPPQEPSQLRHSLEDIDGGIHDSVSSGLSESQLESSAALPGLPQSTDSDLGSRGLSESHVLPIAIALSVAVPISLLVGAIIGFLVRGQQ